MEKDHSYDVYIDPDYRLVCGSGVRVSGLEEKVNALILEGYRPLGGPISDGQGRIYQAMERERGEKS